MWWLNDLNNNLDQLFLRLIREIVYLRKLNFQGGIESLFSNNSIAFIELYFLITFKV